MDAAAAVDSMAQTSEGPVKLLLIQSNIYPVGKEAGEIKLTIASTQTTTASTQTTTDRLTDIPLHEPVLYLGTEMIKKVIGEIQKISFLNTYQLGKAKDKKTEAETKEKEKKTALEKAKTEETKAKQAVENETDPGKKAAAQEALKNATAAVTKAEAEAKEATAELTKATADADPEKEIADHTVQLSILIGRDASAVPPSGC
ncbi:hypothetical protein H6F89_34185 [Cyanobacteria bacterium FACHB-63]|nr:hypothetical protein [Cyanobacteria bacterium FACHB-63]